MLYVHVKHIYPNRFTSSVTYFGLSWNTSNLGGNDYVNFGIAAVVEVPAYLVLLFTLDTWGRKNNVSSGMLLSGISLLLTYFVPSGKWNENYPDRSDPYEATIYELRYSLHHRNVMAHDHLDNARKIRNHLFVGGNVRLHRRIVSHCRKEYWLGSMHGLFKHRLNASTTNQLLGDSTYWHHPKVHIKYFTLIIDVQLDLTFSSMFQPTYHSFCLEPVHSLPDCWHYGSRKRRLQNCPRR